jgi:hypothetical protein
MKNLPSFIPISGLCTLRKPFTNLCRTDMIAFKNFHSRTRYGAQMVALVDTTLEYPFRKVSYNIVFHSFKTGNNNAYRVLGHAGSGGRRRGRPQCAPEECARRWWG